MPQPVLTKYKQGDLGMPYPKKKDKMKNLNLSAHGGEGELGMPYPKKKNKNNLNLSAYGGEADPEISTKDYPSKPNNHVQSSFWKKANEKDY